MKSIGFLTGCALALACAHEGKGVVADTGTKMQGAAAGEASQPPADGATAAIRPFNIKVPENALVDLRQRIAATRWPDRETVPGHPGFAQLSYGDDREKSPTRDDVLDDITLYWLTNTGTSAARLYWENAGRGVTIAAAQKTAEISLPVAITVTELRVAFKSLRPADAKVAAR